MVELVITATGNFGYITVTNPRGKRPAVNLKSEIETNAGDGTINNPYRLGGRYKNTNRWDNASFYEI